MASGAGSCPQARVATRNSQIHEAVQRGNLAEVADVVQKDWGAVNEPGSQLLRTAAIERGPRADAARVMSMLQRTPLMLAARWGKVDLIEYLGSQGARLEDVDTAQRTALHWATEYGRTTCVRALLQLGANPNAKDMKGLTPLHYAVQWAQPESLQALLDHGSNVRAVDGEGQRPIELLAKRTVMTPACLHIHHTLTRAEQALQSSPVVSMCPSPMMYGGSSSSAASTPLYELANDGGLAYSPSHDHSDLETDEQPLDAATIQDLMMLLG